jgi:hypothetical protein
MLDDWYDGCGGIVTPGFLWPRAVTGFDGYFGTWQATFQAQQTSGAFLSDCFDVTLTFDELCKGKPV